MKQGAVVFDSRLPSALLDQVEAVLDNHCPLPSDRGPAVSFRPSISAGADTLQPALVETISHPVFEEVAQQLLCANHVRIKPGYKGQCVYPEHTRYVPPTIPYVPTQKWSGETQL